MKAKKGYSGLERFSLSFASNKADLLKLPGNDAKMGVINDLFNVGEDEAARKMFRQALDEITGKLDKILESKDREKEYDSSEHGIASLLLSRES
jgi:hypothetical protein